MNILNATKQANQFIDKLETPNGFKLFERSKLSPYARCFAIFNKYLLKEFEWLEKRCEKISNDLNIDLYKLYQNKINNSIDWRYDKPFLQLFCFTLSCLNILNRKLNNQNLEILIKLLDIDVKMSLKKKGVDQGLEKSGNYSMFIAIFNIYANKYLQIERSQQIQEWLDFNIRSINKNGFWGNSAKIDYLQFQNGYHQYEIFEHLKIKEVPWNKAARNTLLMGDEYGHFAPYPGGGGCYDYDATFILTSEFVDDIGQKNILKKTINSILNDQNSDGGFCESKHLKYYKFPNIKNIINHVISQPNHIRFWSIIMNLNFSRYKHRNIYSYWAQPYRYWNESNSWDTFFRLLTIYRICNFLNMTEKDLFKINNFPGIG